MVKLSKKFLFLHSSEDANNLWFPQFSFCEWFGWISPVFEFHWTELDSFTLYLKFDGLMEARHWSNAENCHKPKLQFEKYPRNK